MTSHYCWHRISNKLKELKKDAINAYLRSLPAYTDTDYSLWKATKGHERPVIKIPPITKNSKGWAKNDKGEAQICAEYLEHTFRTFLRQTADATLSLDKVDDNMAIRQVTCKWT